MQWKILQQESKYGYGESIGRHNMGKKVALEVFYTVGNVIMEMMAIQNSELALGE